MAEATQTETPEEVPLTTHAAEGVSAAIGTTVIAREAATTLVDPTIAEAFPYNAEMNMGVMAGFTLTVAAEAVADRLKAGGHERAGDLVERGKKLIAWAGSAACQLAFATGEAAQTGDTKLGMAIGLASTTFGIGIGNRFNRSKRHNEPRN